MENYNSQSDPNVRFILDNKLHEMCAVETANGAENDDFNRLCWIRLKERSAEIGYVACALKVCTGGVEYSFDGDKEVTTEINCAMSEPDNESID